MWAWACLSCNATWHGTSAHSCAPQERLREFWTYRLRWSPALRHETEQAVRALVSAPISRTRLVEILGQSWMC